MPIKVHDIQPPTGLVRLAFRLPIWLYRAGLGRFLGDRFLELAHTGRRSGLPRRAVLEVVRHDNRSGTYTIAAGFGERSDWYRNIRANPYVEIHSSGAPIQAIAVPLTADEAGDELVEYAPFEASDEQGTLVTGEVEGNRFSFRPTAVELQSFQAASESPYGWIRPIGAPGAPG